MDKKSKEPTVDKWPVGKSQKEHLALVKKKFKELGEYAEEIGKDRASDDDAAISDDLHSLRMALMKMWGYAAKKESEEIVEFEIYDALYSMILDYVPHVRDGLIAMFRVVSEDVEGFDKKLRQYVGDNEAAALFAGGGYILEYWGENYEELVEPAKKMYKKGNKLNNGGDTPNVKKLYHRANSMTQEVEEERERNEEIAEQRALDNIIMNIGDMPVLAEMGGIIMLGGVRSGTEENPLLREVIIASRDGEIKKQHVLKDRCIVEENQLVVAGQPLSK